MANTIFIKGFGRYEEGIAAEVLYPGHLLLENSAGKKIKHNVAGGSSGRFFAIEDSLQGRTIATAYAVNDPVFGRHAFEGDVVQARLAIGAVAVAKGDALESAGDGTLRKVLLSSNGKLFQNAASSTPIVAAGTTIVPYDVTYTLPANILSVGDVLHIRAKTLVLDNNSTDTVLFTLKLGTTVLAVTPTVDVADNDVGSIDFYVTVRTIGASGTMTGTGTSALGAPGTATLRAVGLSSTALDTTTSKAITVNQTWSAAHADNEAQLDDLYVELIRGGAGNVIGFADEVVDNSAGDEEVFVRTVIAA